MRTTKFLLLQIVSLSLLLLAGSRPCAQAMPGARYEARATGRATVGVGKPETSDTRCRSEARGVQHRQALRP